MSFPISLRNKLKQKRGLPRNLLIPQGPNLSQRLSEEEKFPENYYEYAPQKPSRGVHYEEEQKQELPLSERKDISEYKSLPTPNQGMLNVVKRLQNPEDNQIFYWKKPMAGEKFQEDAALKKIETWNRIAKNILPDERSLHNAYLVKDQPGILYPEILGKRAGGRFQGGSRGRTLYNALLGRGISHHDMQNNPSNALILGNEYGEKYNGSIFPLDLSGVSLKSNFDREVGPIFESLPKRNFSDYSNSFSD